ncbi:MAG: hypothetical protein ABID45_01970 [Patescibacteria group bacterium]
MPTCKNCQKQFKIEKEDEDFYSTIKIPNPDYCPQCRMQLRLAHVNLINLYPTKCDLTNNPIITSYPKGVPFPIYNIKDWHSDKWQPLEYDQKYDFNRPFFDQYQDLLNKIPHPAIHTIYTSLQNSEYINAATYLKNCYLIFDSDYDEDCYYGYSLQKDKDVMDAMRVRDSELSYECIDCVNIYNCRYLQDSRNCNDCYFLYQCSSCQNCFGCVNLHAKQYCWFNKQLSQEDYNQKLIEINLGSRKQIDDWSKKFEDYKKDFPKIAFHGYKNENITGDYLYNCKNAKDCFDSYGLENCRYILAAFLPLKDSYDCFECGEDASLLYQLTNSGFKLFNCKNSAFIFGSENIEYSQHIHSGGKDLFGCFGLRKQSNCILNKKYTKQKYEEIKGKIMDQMKQTGEYGRFFPPELSPYGYNISLAGLYLPSNKESVIAKGFKWQDEASEFQSSTYEVPENIKDVKDDILDDILADENTGRNYKIIKQELEFYRLHNIPVPKKCFTERHKDRLAKRPTRNIYQIKCAKCNKETKTTHNPEHVNNIYCQNCFKTEVY